MSQSADMWGGGEERTEKGIKDTAEKRQDGTIVMSQTESYLFVTFHCKIRNILCILIFVR